jgi:alkane 1-monooxygenase
MTSNLNPVQRYSMILQNPLYSLQYLFVFTIPLVCFWSSYHIEWASWATLLYAFGLIPIVEWIIPANGKAHDYKSQDGWAFDTILFLCIPVLYGLQYRVFDSLKNQDIFSLQAIGLILGLGICGGVIGINVAHELGHRTSVWYKFAAHLLLLPCSFLHFYLEHNYGHHKQVATPNDPATARKGESLYRFWLRSSGQGYVHAWTISRELYRRKASLIPIMPIYHLIILGYYILIGYFFGWSGVFCLAISSAVSILLLETVNYIEHYGLEREKLPNGTYEQVQANHAWDSEQLIGRIALFELSRHADHHQHSSKTYYQLNPQIASYKLPTGYPGSMILAAIPWLWFKIINDRLEKNTKQYHI